ncbi:FAD/NAD(P)-binding domain-containing protein [Hypoxylon sp. FL1150]|nr:FAD/NAD(P)-binding domain-containing protein [Hypoxylon sp. FL1150]
MTSDNVETVDVAIIGAGWYGLASARTFLRLRPDANVLIIDSDSTVGGVWSKDRLYPNLVAQVRLGLFNYSDRPMPPNGGNPKDPRVTGEMIHNYMHEYAQEHDLLRRIRFNTFVTDASQCPRGWRLILRDSDVIIEAEKLLVATGVTSIPYLPPFTEGPDDASIPIIHSRDLGASFEAIQDPAVRKVVVVGAAKSAYDAVYLMLSMGKQVTWVIRADGAGPLAILPFKVLGLINSVAFASTRLMTHLSPSILNTRGPLYRMLQRNPLGRWVVGRFWSFLDYVSGVHAGYGDGDHVGGLKPEIDRQSVFWSHSGLGVVTLPDFWPTLHSQNLTIVRDEIRTIEARDVHLKSGASVAGVDYAVMCTGWGDHFAMFDAAHKERIGLPAYTGRDLYSFPIVSPSSPSSSASSSSSSSQQQGGAGKKGLVVDWGAYDEAADKLVDEKLPFLAKPPGLKQSPDLLDARRQKKWRLYRRAVPVEMAAKGDRSLAVLGQIHTVQTPLVAEVQSLWAILYLLGEIKLPSVDEMATEVALWNAWTRKRYLNQGQKFPYSLYDFLPYIDSIFADLGLKSRRKSNVVAEILSPYEPRDFNGFVDEYLKKRGLNGGSDKV